MRGRAAATRAHRTAGIIRAVRQIGDQQIGNGEMHVPSLVRDIDPGWIIEDPGPRVAVDVAGGIDPRIADGERESPGRRRRSYGPRRTAPGHPPRFGNERSPRICAQGSRQTNPCDTSYQNQTNQDSTGICRAIDASMNVPRPPGGGVWMAGGVGASRDRSWSDEASGAAVEAAWGRRTVLCGPARHFRATARSPAGASCASWRMTR